MTLILEQASTTLHSIPGPKAGFSIEQAVEQSHEVYRALMRILGWGLGEGYYSHAFGQNIWRAATVRRMLGEGVRCFVLLCIADIIQSLLRYLLHLAISSMNSSPKDGMFCNSVTRISNEILLLGKPSWAASVSGQSLGSIWGSYYLISEYLPVKFSLCT